MATPTIHLTGEEANSFSSLMDAEDYFDLRVDTDEWDVATDDKKIIWLVMATNRLKMEDWEGSLVDEDQALPFPRKGIVDREGREYATDAHPREVIHSQYEIALLISKNEAWFADRGTEGWDVIHGVGEPSDNLMANDLPQIVKRLLATLLKVPDSILGVY